MSLSLFIGTTVDSNVPYVLQHLTFYIVINVHPLYLSLICTCKKGARSLIHLNKNSEYDQEIPQSQTADSPVAPRGRAAQPSRDTRKTN